ncbi:PrsW family glutamic-type intramembrane protease [Arthrobacter sp. GMC3]|uniref:PrsW family glutamic-type intramembrane protease n=1 Tax=Arthrobacter sp. GMC3 TaxID=2058894 RepID=UPI000CE392FA|nr:PrsW family glutamic-type intramembrane protease [Arthrobacter sp. GMC3]
MSTITAPTLTTARPHRHGWWWKALLTGLVLWGLTVWVTAVTMNTNLIPTLILIGSFLVPFCVVLFILERLVGNVTTLQVILAFVVGGICGILGASLLEARLVASVFTYVGVGFIEEFVKGVILVVIGWRVVPKTAGQGALLGAAVGAGFAAFESAGYAFNAVITASGFDLGTMLQTEALRAILTPVGHVLWTAILGAVLFAAARGHTRYRFRFSIIAAYVTVSLLHALWDSMSGITSFLALLLTGTIRDDLHFGFIPPGSQQEAASMGSVLYVAGVALTAILGIVILWRILRHHARATRTALD